MSHSSPLVTEKVYPNSPNLSLALEICFAVSVQVSQHETLVVTPVLIGLFHT